MLSNPDLDALSSEDFLSQFRLVWKGTEIKLTDDVSVFKRGKGKCTLFIIAGIHGEERASVVSLYNWAKKLANLKVHGKICVIPIINPKAWGLRRRSTGNQNLNFVWNDKRAVKHPQIQKVMKMLRKNPPVVFLDLHEDGGQLGGEHYICRNKGCSWGLQMQKDLAVSKRMGIWTKHDYQTAESFVHSLGVDKSFTVETSPYHHIDDRCTFHQSVIEYCFEFANNKENW